MGEIGHEKRRQSGILSEAPGLMPVISGPRPRSEAQSAPHPGAGRARKMGRDAIPGTIDVARMTSAGDRLTTLQYVVSRIPFPIAPPENMNVPVQAA